MKNVKHKNSSRREEKKIGKEKRICPYGWNNCPFLYDREVVNET